MSEDRPAPPERTIEPPASSPTSRENAVSKESTRVAFGIFLGILLVLAIAGACVIGWFGQEVRDRIRPPTATPSPATEIITVKPPTVREIQQMAELSTVKFAMSAEITDERVPDDFRANLGVKEELLLLAYGEVAAGFDLSKMDEGDIWVDGTRIQLTLPPVEILYSKLDTERTRVIYYKKSLFVQRDISMEGNARQEAEQAIRDAAIEQDILDHASRYGELFFSNWLRSMGFTEVRVVVR
jgi:hypothetical protein